MCEIETRDYRDCERMVLKIEAMAEGLEDQSED